MQPWLKVQRTGLFLFSFSGVLLLIYALGYISDVYLFFAYGNKGLVDFYNDMQAVNAVMLRNAILVIVFACILFISGLGKYPAGLYTLIIVVLISAASLYIALDAFFQLVQARINYSGLDLSSLNRYIERGAITYRYSTLT